jgi:outer membrane protein TolC
MLAAGASAAGAQAPVVTLEEARRLTILVDPQAVAARSQTSTAAWERRAALTNILTPSVSADASYVEFSDPFFNLGTGEISPKATSATIQARYTLLGNGKFSNLRSARASVDRAEANEIATRFASWLETDAAYFAVLANKELARVASDRLRRAEESFEIARMRVLAGEAIASDSLQLLLEVNRARVEMLSRDSALVASRLLLGHRIGLSTEADAAPIDTATPPPLSMTQEEMIAEVRTRGPSIQAARAAERYASAALGAEREHYLPEVSLDATFGAYDAELFPSALHRSQFAVTVTLPIWNGGQRELAVARARAARDVAAAERLDRERSAAEVVAQAYQGYVTARASIDLAKVGVTVAKENYRVQSVRYAEGAGTILDLLESQVALSEAEASLVQSTYATHLALARLESLLGRRVE